MRLRFSTRGAALGARARAIARRGACGLAAGAVAVLCFGVPGAAGGPAPLGPGSEIRDRIYAPSEITVAAGQTIAWRNETLGPHTVTSRTELFNSGRIDPGTTYALKFANPGTYDYYCTVHPTMTGVVTVLAIPPETVLVHLSSRHSAHGTATTLRAQVARAGVKALLQAAPPGARAFRTIARAPLGSQGTVSFALGKRTSKRRLRVLVPAAYGQPQLVSRTVSAPS